MKKSKIIIPALAIIAVSTAASIAGSVAWFTASRQASISAGTFAVVKTNANLQCDIEAGVATSIDTTGGTETIVLGNNKLTDGSVNHKTGKAYTPNDSGTGLITGDKQEIDLTQSKATLDPLLERATLASGKVYTAATFDVTFTVAFGALDKDMGLYLDAANSSFTVAGDNPGAPVTAKGFRVAFIQLEAPSTGSNIVPTVFAGLQNKETVIEDDPSTDDDESEIITNCKYVASTSNFAGTGYVANDYDLVDKTFKDNETARVLPTEQTARSTALNRPDRIGMFKFSSGNEVTLKYRVVCWFEGTDPMIVNRASADEYQGVNAVLSFSAIDLSAS